MKYRQMLYPRRFQVTLAYCNAQFTLAYESITIVPAGATLTSLTTTPPGHFWSCLSASAGQAHPELSFHSKPPASRLQVVAGFTSPFAAS